MSTSLNITVLDQSPMWNYFPSREGDSSSSWQSTWSGSPDSSYDATHVAVNIAQGTSAHTTSLRGASVQIDFVGLAVTIFGQGTAGAYTTTLDGGKEISGAPTGSVLATYGGLSDDEKHTITLKVTQNTALTLSYAAFTIRSDLQTSSVKNTTENAVTTGANNALSTNSFFSTSGSGFSNQHADQSYTRLDTDSSAATMLFTCSNTSALFVYGTTNWNHQTFSVELNPAAGVSQGARIFNGTSKWFVLDNLIFWEGGMDPTKSYQVKVTNLIGGSYTDIHSVVMMNLPEQASSSSGSVPQSTSGASPSPTAGSFTTPSKSSSVGKTVAIAVSVVAALAAVILLFFLCWRRRSKNRSRLSLEGMIPTPFGAPPHNRDSSFPSMSETPTSFGHLPRTPSSLHDPYSNSQYPYSTNPAVNSVHDIRDRALGTHGTRYTELSTDDFNPYSEPGKTRPYTGSASNLSSTVASTSGPQSGPIPQPRPRKSPIPSEDASSSSRPVRQEVDAGRVPVPDEEEILPPNYDPTWAS
ncbi:hypothetical protein DFH09DRAFT_1129364 [Mycena vulgaris]|nr:hypothetical protein DFH09DRAFT_1129364 [Mycena vulgaris]